jgi:Leu/Phe-tRNA-protein transferase
VKDRSEFRKGFWWELMQERKALSLDGRMILKWIFKKYDGGVFDLFHVLQDMVQWWTVMNTIMSFYLHY